MNAHPHYWGLTAMTWGYIVWGLWIFLGFGLLEALARDLGGVAPWFTFSQTFKALIRDHPYLGIVFAQIIFTLIVHLFFPANKWGL